MELDFGRVKNYRAKGYGFVEGFFDKSHRFDRKGVSDNSYDVFFHIREIKDKDVQNILKANEDWPFSVNVYLWYAIEETNKNDSVKKVYRNVRDIPEDILFKFLDNISEIILKNYYGNSGYSKQEFLIKEPSFYSQLFADSRIPDDKLDNILKVLIKKFILKSPYGIGIKSISDFSFIRETQKKAVKFILGSHWNNELAEDVTRALIGDEQYEVLYSERQEALKEYLFKSWKDITFFLSDWIKELTLKNFGEEQYNLLCSDRDLLIAERDLLLLEERKSRFIPVDGLVNDVKTDLMWLRFAYGQTWENNIAMGEATVVENIVRNAEVVVDLFNKQGGYADFTDWRIPSIGELESLGIEVINSDTFPNSPSRLWSSTRYFKDKDFHASWNGQKILCKGHTDTIMTAKDNKRGWKSYEIACCVRFVRGEKIICAK